MQQGSGSTLWSLQVTSTAGQSVGAIALLVSDSLTSFTPSPFGPPPICALVVGGFCGLDPVPAAPGFNLLTLSFSPPLFPSFPLLLGTFEAESSSALVQVLPADDIAGGTVFNAQGEPIPDFSIRVVPEPATSLLLLAALAALVAAARKPNGI